MVHCGSAVRSPNIPIIPTQFGVTHPLEIRIIKTRLDVTQNSWHTTTGYWREFAVFASWRNSAHGGAGGRGPEAGLAAEVDSAAPAEDRFADGGVVAVDDVRRAFAGEIVAFRSAKVRSFAERKTTKSQTETSRIADCVEHIVGFSWNVPVRLVPRFQRGRMASTSPVNLGKQSFPDMLSQAGAWERE